MKNLKLAQDIVFTEEEEKQFQGTIERHICRFLWIPVGILMLFQLFNIFHALIHTNFQLNTVASRVYFSLYVLIFAVSVIALVLLKLFSKSPQRESPGAILRLQYIYVVVAVMWAVAVTLYDQRVSENISVYLVMIMSVVVLAYLPPTIFVPLLLIAECIMLIGAPMLQNRANGDYFGFYINSAGLTITALFVGYYRYYSQRKDFKNKCIIEEKNQEILEKSAELDFIANHDSLTGLLNRRFLTNFLPRIYLKTKRTQAVSAVYMIDIDNFKNYNDTYGHVMGDECLKRIADAMELLMDTGKLFRYGGEEFVVIKPDVKPDECKEAGDLLCACVEALKIQAADPAKVVTVSVGYSCGQIIDEKSWRKLLQNADEALYCAKKNGKNQTCSAEEMQ